MGIFFWNWWYGLIGSTSNGARIPRGMVPEIDVSFFQI
jgi:hypothetical protein